MRNFVQLCMEGYYDNTPFHRVIKGFMVQGGDPTGTGECAWRLDRPLHPDVTDQGDLRSLAAERKA